MQLIAGQLDALNPEKIAAGLTAGLVSALAWGCVILLSMLIASNVFWVRAYLAQTEKRFESLQEHNAQTTATLTSVVSLSLKQTEGLDVLDRAIDRFTSREA